MSYIGNTPSETFHTATSQVFNGDGSTTAFTLEKRVNRAEDLEVFVNNIQQQPTVAYSANNTTLTFTEAPDSATGNIYVVYRMFAQENTFNAIHDFTDEVTFNGNVNYKDNVKAKFGDAGDLEIYHDGSNSIIEDVGTGGLRLKTGNAGRIQFQNAEGDTLARFDGNGDNQLFHNNIKRFETTSTGVTVTGTLVSDVISIADGSSTQDRLTIGTNDDFFIYHDNQTVIANVNGSGPIKIQGKFGEQSVVANQDGSVELYHNGTKKFETTSSGVTITGSILPSADDTHDLGSSSAQWRDIYTGDINLNNTKTRDNEVDGTRGSWTIQEGADDLFLINRLNGKKYKFKLEEM